MRTDVQLAQRRATLNREVASMRERLLAFDRLASLTPVDKRGQTMMRKSLRRREAELARMDAGDRHCTCWHGGQRST